MFGPSDEPARPELTFLERALGGLAPRPARLDRDALLFRAGQSAAPRRWLWPCSTAVATTVAVVLGVLLAVRPQPTVIERIVPVPALEPTTVEKPSAAEPAPETPEVPDSWTPRRRLQEHLLRHGLDGLGEFSPEPEPPPRSNIPLTHPLSSMGGSRP
jgi:hypothetical protein